ncbi:hypothetical protein OpiT1DRAFT_04336 [Opitutaceae bacterium TAV1]|nr:hypothetical protein OpiT1DRAFT_04336 [Opitutaceae bacterium TAV1]
MNRDHENQPGAIALMLALSLIVICVILIVTS